MVPDTPLDQLNGERLQAIIVPGGDPGSVLGEDGVRVALVTASANHTLIAGICGGVLVLAASGLLRGRRITYNYRSPWASPEVEAFVADRWTGVDVVEDRTIGVVADGNLVTALPSASIRIAMTVCEKLGVYPRRQAGLIGRRLRGEFVEELYQY